MRLIELNWILVTTVLAQVAVPGVARAQTGYSDPSVSAADPESPGLDQAVFPPSFVEAGVPLLHALGRYPLCEPSAAELAPWNSSLFLVADDEVHDRLFGFPIEGDRLGEIQDIALPSDHQPRDIEALAGADNLLVVVGSHSRNRRCERKPRRQRIQLLRWVDGRDLVEVGHIDVSGIWMEATRDLDACTRSLFVQPLPSLARQFCEALVSSEREAERGDCADAFNIEGAATLVAPDDVAPVELPVFTGTAPAASAAIEGTGGATVVPHTGGPRVWLGLRSPLLESGAVLLRLDEGLGDLRFDALALIDLDGRGIRSLAVDEDSLWGIAGPPGDVVGSFLLFRVPLADLLREGTIEPEVHRNALPPGSEGLVVVRGQVFITVEGSPSEGSHEDCRVGAGYLVVGSF